MSCREINVLHRNVFGRSAVSIAMQGDNPDLMVAVLSHSSAEPPADFVSEEETEKDKEEIKSAESASHDSAQ